MGRRTLSLCIALLGLSGVAEAQVQGLAAAYGSSLLDAAYGPSPDAGSYSVPTSGPLAAAYGPAESVAGPPPAARGDAGASGVASAGTPGVDAAGGAGEDFNLPVLGLGVPMSSVIQSTRPPFDNLFRDYNIGIDPRMRVGDASLGLSVLSGGLSSDLGIPFMHHGIRPADALVHAGPVYLDVTDLMFKVLYSDNTTLADNNHREDGAISILSLGLTGVIQWTKDLQLAVGGRFVVLPFEGKAGFAGFGARDSLRALADARPLFAATLSDSFSLAGWDWTLYDLFLVRDYGLMQTLDANYFEELELLQNQQFNEVDRAGRYHFGGEGLARDAPERQYESFNERFGGREGIEYSNLTRLYGQRSLPIQARMHVLLERWERWFDSQAEESGAAGGDPLRWRELATVSVVGERPSMRFQPFASYTASRSSWNHDLRHAARVGASGPVTQNMSLYGSVGYTRGPRNRSQRGGRSDAESTLWTLQLTHRPGPLTWHQIEISRSIVEPEEILQTWLRYRLSRTLGPRMRASFTTAWSEHEDRDGTDTTTKTWQTSGSLFWDTGPRSSLNLAAVYIEDENSSGDVTETWIGRANYSYKIGPKTNLRLSAFYKYDDPPASGRHSHWLASSELNYALTGRSSVSLEYRYDFLSSTVEPPRSYYENLAILTYRRQF